MTTKQKIAATKAEWPKGCEAQVMGVGPHDKLKEECGVFGIFGHPEAANLTYLGLYALQHRGQESAGIAASDGTEVRISKSMGYVADAFSERTLEKLRGHVAIGHVRYSTAGDSRVDNAQPILIDCAHGQIAIGHNGNLVNASDLKDELVRHGSIFQTSTDTEVILHLYARSRATSIDDAIVEALANVQGAFSLVLMTKDRLIAVRDPHGFRPLALGRLGDAVIVCSETCALDLIGATYVRDVEPGEVIIVSATGVKSIKPFPAAPLAQCVFEHVYFSRPDSYVFGESVNEVRTNLGKLLAREQSRGCRRHRARAGLGRVRRDRVCRRVGHSHACRTDSQPLRRPHVHRAATGDSPFRRAREVEPRAQHSRRQARGARRRLARARHHEPQDRQNGEGGGGEGGAHAHQLPADDFALLLRRGYAAPIGVDRRNPHAR